MSLTPRKTLNDDFIKGMSCAICGNPNLTITHVEKFPDFVSCNRCGAAFVVENEGSWVMYGKIPSEYPQTSQFALRQWTWLDAVAQRASDEREMGSAPSLEPQEPVQEIEVQPAGRKESAPPFVEEIRPDQEDEVPKPAPLKAEIAKNGVAEDISHSPPFSEEVVTPVKGDLESSIQDDLMEFPSDEFPPLEEDLIPTPFEPIQRTKIEEEDQPDQLEDELFPGMEGSDEKAMEEIVSAQLDTDTLFPDEETAQQEMVAPVREPEIPAEAEERAEDKPSIVPVGEPEPDKRHRVTIRGIQPKYPKNYCAHCLQTPVKLKAIMRGALPDPSHPGKRKLVPLELPFCRDCQKRMNAQSDEERNAKLLAFLISGLISLIAIVATLALGIVNLSENLITGIIVLLIVAILGFAIPFLISLTWTSRYPPPRDAAFVLSTLLVNESGEDLTEFEWRNPGYAELFRQVNQESAIGEVTPVQDRVTFTEIPPATKKQEKEPKPKQKPRKKPAKEDEPGPDSQQST
jgi:hypothetical protein